jgi:hypothetical protein
MRKRKSLLDGSSLSRRTYEPVRLEEWSVVTPDELRNLERGCCFLHMGGRTAAYTHKMWSMQLQAEIRRKTIRGENRRQTARMQITVT